MPTQFIVDERGKKTKVVLDIKEFKRLQELLEEYEDALDLKKAIKGAEGFTDYQEIRSRLKSEGKL